MRVILALSPVVILLTSGGLVRMLYARKYRNAWIAALACSMIAWIAMLLNGLMPPTAIDLSPDLGALPLQFDYDFNMDPLAWEMGLAALTILMGLLFLQISQSRERQGAQGASLMVLGATGVLSMLAGSLLSTALMWTAFDLVLLIQTSAGQYGTSASGWPKRGISLILIRAGLLMGALALGGGVGLVQDGFSGLGSPLAWLLFLGAVFSRACDVMPGDTEHEVQHWGLEFGVIISVGLALTPVSRALSANDVDSMAGVIEWAGLLGIVIGGVGFALVEDLRQGAAFYMLGMIGLGVYLGTLGGSGSGVAHTAILGMSVLGVARTTGIFASWERPLLWIAAAIFAGVPPFVGMLVASTLANIWRGGGAVLSASLALLGYGGLVSGVLRQTRAERSEWQITEELSRVFYAIGLGIPFLPLLGFGLQNLGGFSVSGLLGAVVVFMIGLGIADLSLRFDVFERARALASAGLGVVRVLRKMTDAVLGAVGLVVGAIVDVLEGEGAVIWLLVVLLFLGLVMRGGAA